MRARKRVKVILSALVLPLILSACSQSTDLADGVKSMVMPASAHGYSAREKECLMRAMFFESNRSSRDGLVSVGTVVMNRVRSQKWGDSICGVVGAKRQFAPGVMTRKMNSKALPDVEAAADSVLKGERNPKVKNSMFFHTAGLKFPYKNMHYTVVAGGNAFYEKRNRNGDPVVLPPEKAVLQPAVMIAKADAKQPRLQARPAMSGRSETMVAMARPAISGRADGGSSSPAPAKAAEPTSIQTEAQPVAVAMAMDGPSPSGQATAAAPFPDAAAPGEPALPAVTEAKPTPNILVADAARADGWTAGASALPASAPAHGPEPEVSYAVDQDDADAIGAMIAGEERPMMGFN